MIIVDTSVWIDFLRGNSETTQIMRSYLKKRHIIAVSAVFGELLQGVKNKREKNIITEFWENLPKVNENELFLEAGKLSNQQKCYAQGVGLIDCYLLAASIENDCALWTKDKKLLAVIDNMQTG